MTIEETWRQGIDRIAAYHIEDYKKYGISIIKNTRVPKEILRMVYNSLVSEKSIVPIESLTPAEKKELIKEVGESDDIVNVCKALYVIKKVLK